MKNIADIRTDYVLKTLDQSDVLANPMKQFEAWFDEAIAAQVIEPNAMCLSTVGADNKPSGRIVLLKGISENGLVFFTNYESKKGNEILNNPNVALTFFWQALERQVRVEGIAYQVSKEESNTYFQSRPYLSKISALASPQSQKISSRQELEKIFETFKQEFSTDNSVPLPDNWGGYCVEPNYFEFWQGRGSRLHDRIAYIKLDNNWYIERLAP